jgi:hypothetical protein
MITIEYLSRRKTLVDLDEFEKIKDNDCLELYLYAVKKCYLNLKLIENQSLELCIAACKITHFAFPYCKVQSETLCFDMVDKYPYYVKKKTYKICSKK